VLDRLAWPEGATVAELLARRPFETGRTTTQWGLGTVYALRLGNREYPHMKLQVQPWPGPEGYLLSVNTHDQVADLDPEMPGYAEFRAKQARNQVVKEAIEQDWEAAGLPTFLNYLRGYLRENGGPSPG
jgi:hypothetical protein